jgi:hypothetical protein
MMSACYVATNVTGGTQSLTVTFDTTLYDCHFEVSSFYNVAASSAIDGESGSSVSGSSISAGPITTTAPGDLIYQYGHSVQTPDTGSDVTRFSPGSGFSLLSADVFIGTVAQYSVQSSAGQINPTLTIAGGAEAFNTIAIALKPASQGTPPPPGIRVQRIQHVWYNRNTPEQFPCSGNLLALMSAFATSNANLTRVTDSMGNTWAETDTSYSLNPQCFYAPNALSSNDFSFSVGGAPSSATGVSFVAYDITGASESPYDTQIQSSNTDATFAGTFTQGVITPSTPNGLILATNATDLWDITGGGPGTLDTVTYGNIFCCGNQVGADTMDNVDGYQHYYNPDTSPVTLQWTLSNGPSFFEATTAIAFKAAALSTPTPTPSKGFEMLAQYASTGKSGARPDLPICHTLDRHLRYPYARWKPGNRISRLART